MINYFEKEPAVTQCLIIIQETQTKPIYSFNVYPIVTFVKKYYIGLGQNFKDFDIINHRLLTKESDIYPLIQIDRKGRLALKCPGIDGGIWFDEVNFGLCKSSEVGHLKVFSTVHAIADDINLFWLYLIVKDALKATFDAYVMDLDVLYPTLVRPVMLTTEITPFLPLRRYEPIELVMLHNSKFLFRHSS